MQALITRPSPAAERSPHRTSDTAVEGPSLDRWFATGLLLADLALLTVAALIALGRAQAAHLITAGAILLVAVPPALTMILGRRGRYRRQLRPVLLDRIADGGLAVSFVAMLLLVALLVTGVNLRPGPFVGWVWIAELTAVAVASVAADAAETRLRRRGRLRQRALLVGGGLVAAHIARKLKADPTYGLDVVGFVDADSQPALTVAGERIEQLGALDEIQDVIVARKVHQVIVAFAREHDRNLLSAIHQAHALGAQVSFVPRFFDTLNRRIAFEHVGGLPLMTMRPTRPRGWQFAVKHTLDRLIAGLSLILLAPVFLVIAIAVRLSSPGPVLFRQRRVGRDGCAFELLKFRSMRLVQEDASGFSPVPGSAPGGVEGDDRRTRVGTFLRRTSLDELPQIINVLRGEMSFVGPRPERIEFVDLFNEEIARYGERHRVKAGITGWAQVHGLRGQTSIADRTEWDNYYIENWSLWLDLKILLMTVTALLDGDPTPQHRLSTS